MPLSLDTTGVEQELGVLTVNGRGAFDLKPVPPQKAKATHFTDHFSVISDHGIFSGNQR